MRDAGGSTGARVGSTGGLVSAAGSASRVAVLTGRLGVAPRVGWTVEAVEAVDASSVPREAGLGVLWSRGCGGGSVTCCGERAMPGTR